MILTLVFWLIIFFQISSECPLSIENSPCAQTTCCHPKSFFLQRSQGANTAREMVGWEKLPIDFPIGQLVLIYAWL